MPSCRKTCIVVLLLAGTMVGQHAPGDLDQLVVRQLDSSKVTEHLFYLTDAVGPRVVGSPALETARGWLVARLKEYGFQSIRREENPPMQIAPGITWNPKGWSWARLVVQQLSPWPATLIGVPVLYSPSMNGPRRGEVVIAQLPSPQPSAVSSFIAEYRGKLKGKFLLAQRGERGIPREDRPMVHRYTDAEMREFESAPIGSPRPGPASAVRPAPPAQTPPRFEETLAAFADLHKFLQEEEVLGIVGAARGEGGTLVVRPPAAPPIVSIEPPPTFDLAAEHYNRIIRLVQHGVPVRIEADLQTEFYGSGTANLLAEIPGTDKRDEIVIAGAHLDSWHGGTGATDNAANVAVLLETARILATMGIHPRRSIRFAFWDGEELGTLGSRGYAALHLVDPRSREKKREYEDTSCYFNLDFGGGRIRGVYLQGRTELQLIFASWLEKVAGEKLVASPRTTLGSDQATFEGAGLPGISFIQDPLDYVLRTNHTTMDVSDYVSTDDLNHNVRVLANLLFEAANADEKLPRRGGRQ